MLKTTFIRGFIALCICGLLATGLSGCAGKHKQSEEQEIRAFLQNSASFYVQKGVEALSAMNYQEALTQFRQAESLTPYDPVVHNNKGVAFYHLGLIDSAIYYYQTAVRLRPDYTRAYGNLAKTYLDADQLEYALAAAAKVVQLAPATAQGHILRAEIFEKKGMGADALQAYQEALSIEPWLTDVRNNLGVLYFRSGRLDQAIDMYQQVLARDSTFSVAYFNLGNALARKCLLEDALFNYDKALFYKPEMTAARNNHGLINLFMGRLTAASSDFYRAIDNDDSAPASYYNLSIVQSRLDSLPQALRSIEKAIIQDSLVANFHLQHGLVLERMNRSHQATLAFNRAVQLDSTLSSGYNSLGNVLAESDPLRARKAYEKALANYDDFLMQRFARTGRAIDKGYFDLLATCKDNWQISADHAMVFNNLGKVYIRLNQYDQAARTFKRAVELQPDLWEPYENLSVIYFAQKKESEAKKMMAQGRVNRARAAFKVDSLGAADAMLQEAIRLHPRLGDAYALLALIYERRGNPRNAETAIKTGLRQDRNNFNLHAAYGRLMSGQKRYDEAITHLQDALRIKPHSADIYLQLADIHNLLGDPTRSDSLYAQGRFLRGNDFEEAGSLDDALQEYQSAQQINPGKADYVARQGLIYLKKRLNNQAENLLNEALAMEEQNVLALYGKGWLLGERKQYGEAIQLLTRVTAADSSYAQAYQALAVCSLFAGDRESARRYADKARALGIILKEEFIESLQTPSVKP